MSDTWHDPPKSACDHKLWLEDFVIEYSFIRSLYNK